MVEGTNTSNGLWSIQDTLTGHMYPMPNKQIAEAVMRLHGYCKVTEGWPDYMPQPGSQELAPNVVDQALLLTAQIREISWGMDELRLSWFDNAIDSSPKEELSNFYASPAYHVLSAHRDELRKRLMALNFEPDLKFIQQVQDQRIREQQQAAYESFEATNTPKDNA